MQASCFINLDFSFIIIYRTTNIDVTCSFVSFASTFNSSSKERAGLKS